MHGENVNAYITVARAVGNVRARGVRNVKVLALQIRGDQGDKWHSYEVDLPAGGRFKVKHSYACEVHLPLNEPGTPERGAEGSIRRTCLSSRE